MKNCSKVVYTFGDLSCISAVAVKGSPPLLLSAPVHKKDRIERMEALISNFSGEFVYFFISTGL